MRLIVPLAAAFSMALSVGAGPVSAQPGYTWTLYEKPTSLALANEVPDTPQLAAVLECTPGSGQAKVSIYPTGAGAAPVVSDFKTTDATFSAFVKSGKLSIRSDAGSGEIAMDAAHLGKLERFSRLCGA